MENIRWFIAAFLFVAAIVFFIILNPLEAIPAGRRGIVLTWGAPSGTIMQPGLNWRIPIAQSVVEIDVQTQKVETEVAAASKDLQTVSTKVALNYHQDEKAVADLYVKVGKDIESRILAPAIQEAVKSVTARFTAEELITKRQDVKEQIRAILAERLARDFIVVEDFSVVNFDFSRSFNEAIEAKVTAEQNALAAKNKLEQVKFEQQAQIEVAKAQAESIRIQAQAINAQGGADYVKLKAIEKWDGKTPTTMVPDATVPFIDLK